MNFDRMKTPNDLLREAGIDTKGARPKEASPKRQESAADVRDREDRAKLKAQSEAKDRASAWGSEHMQDLRGTTSSERQNSEFLRRGLNEHPDPKVRRTAVEDPVVTRSASRVAELLAQGEILEALALQTWRPDLRDSVPLSRVAINQDWETLLKSREILTSGQNADLDAELREMGEAARVRLGKGDSPESLGPANRNGLRFIEESERLAGQVKEPGG